MSLKRDGGLVLLLLYLGSFGLFVTVGILFREEVRTAQRLQLTVSADMQRIRDEVVGLNAKLGRYEQEYERRFVTMAEGCQSIRTQLYESMMTPAEQFQADIVQRLQRLERLGNSREN